MLSLWRDFLNTPLLQRIQAARWWLALWAFMTLGLAGLLSWLLFTMPGDGASARLSDFTPGGMRITRVLRSTPLRPGDIVLAINGQPLDELLVHPHSNPPRPVILPYTILREGQRQVVFVPLRPPEFLDILRQWWPAYFIGIVNFLLGTYLLLSHPHDRFYRSLAWMLGGAFLQSVGDAFNFQPAAVYWGLPFSFHWLYEELSFLAASATLVSLVFLFPPRWLSPTRQHMVISAIFGLPLLIMAGAWWLAPSPTKAIRASERALVDTFMLEYLLSTVIALWRFRHAATQRARRTAAWLAASALFVLPGLVLYFSPLFRGGDSPLFSPILHYIQLGFPAFIVLGLLRYQALDMERILLQSLLYTLIVWGLALLNTLLLGRIYQRIPNTTLLILISSALIVILYSPLQHLSQRLLQQVLERPTNLSLHLHRSAQRIAKIRTPDALERLLQEEIPLLFPNTIGGLYRLRGHTLVLLPQSNPQAELPLLLPLPGSARHRFHSGLPVQLSRPTLALVLPIQPPFQWPHLPTLALVLTPPPEGIWHTGDLDHLHRWAQQVGLAWHIAQMLKEREAALRQEAHRLEQVVIALVDALGFRDHFTENHSQTLVRYAVETGRALGLDEHRLRDLRWAALLHDIGKIGVPDRILHKPGPLTEEERHLIRQHVEIGAAILRRIPGMERVAEIVYCHHERYDGQGYPRGLQGEAIPLEARILTVVDAFQAMREERVYRPSRPLEEIVAELKRKAGWQFCPIAVSAFLQVLRREFPDLE